MSRRRKGIPIMNKVIELRDSTAERSIRDE